MQKSYHFLNEADTIVKKKQVPDPIPKSDVIWLILFQSR